MLYTIWLKNDNTSVFPCGVSLKWFMSPTLNHQCHTDSWTKTLTNRLHFSAFIKKIIIFRHMHICYFINMGDYIVC